MRVDGLKYQILKKIMIILMIKDHSDSERGNPLPPHRLLFPISNMGYFICIIPDRITHTKSFVTPVVEHWLERKIAQWVHCERSIRRPITPRERSYHGAKSRSFLTRRRMYSINMQNLIITLRSDFGINCEHATPISTKTDLRSGLHLVRPSTKTMDFGVLWHFM